MPRAEEIRDVQRATCVGLSSGWEKWDSAIMEQLGPVGAAIIPGSSARSHLGGMPRCSVRARWALSYLPPGWSPMVDLLHGTSTSG
jgi:hypothetical protein